MKKQGTAAGRFKNWPTRSTPSTKAPRPAGTTSTKVEIDGIPFDSQTEGRFYSLLKRLGIAHIIQFDVQFHKVRPKDRKVPLLKDCCAESVTLYVDFVFTIDGMTHYVDVKGAKESVQAKSKLKYALLKHHLFDEGLSMTSQIRFVYAKDIVLLERVSVGLDALANFKKHFLETKTV